MSTELSVMSPFMNSEASRYLLDTCKYKNSSNENAPQRAAKENNLSNSLI